MESFAIWEAVRAHNPHVPSSPYAGDSAISVFDGPTEGGRLAVEYSDNDG
jgi:hypothetical protein